MFSKQLDTVGCYGWMCGWTCGFAPGLDQTYFTYYTTNKKKKKIKIKKVNTSV